MPYRCKDCCKYFSARTGTVFQSANLPLHKCLMAMYMLTTAKKGVPSMQLTHELSYAQKTAWHLAYRIRKTVKQDSNLLAGEVKADETYIGGKKRNKHNNKQLNSGRGTIGKVIVVGMKERGGSIKAHPIGATNKSVLHISIRANIKAGATIYTDDFRSYKGLSRYNHEVVKHSVGEYVNDKAHTNRIGAFWALLTRGYHSMYYEIDRKHLHRYVNEFSTRYNRRELSTENKY